ncbi:porin [Yoonia sp. BS5-3]|uniref:Outer membrane protein n=1 Tax=Yoonia phaeophyticola TaxID=3137369 RepID=A0ABZ2V525_9RHOB
MEAPITEDWSGFYIGAQLGAGEFVGVGGTEDLSAVGAHVGYMYDFGKFVLGGEFAYNRLDADLAVGTANEEYDTAVVKLRAGYDLGKIMPYVVAGSTEFDMSIDGTSADGAGPMVGIGIMYAVGDNFLLGAEYSSSRIEDFNVTTSTASGVDLDINVLSLRASYKF